LVAACRKVSCRATVAWRKRTVFRDIRTQGNCGLREEVTAAGKTITLRAGLAWCKGTFVRDICTQGNGRPQKELATASRRMTRCTGIAQEKEHGLQKKGQDKMAPRTRKERTSITNGIRAWKSGQQLLLGSIGMHMKALYEMVSVKIMKQNARSSARRWSIKEWTLWRGRSPPKRLKSQLHA
jgi:hypothetical protein